MAPRNGITADKSAVYWVTYYWQNGFEDDRSDEKGTEPRMILFVKADNEANVIDDVRRERRDDDRKAQDAVYERGWIRFLFELTVDDAFMPEIPGNNALLWFLCLVRSAPSCIYRTVDRYLFIPRM